MAKTAALYVLPAILVATAWLRLEEGPNDSRVFWLVVLGLVPALARPLWGRALATVVVVLIAARVALGASLLDARPFDGERDFFGPLFERFERGSLGFYEVAQPFQAAQHGAMHDVLLVAIFGFSLAIALAIAARRPLLAGLMLVAGSIWPATLVPGSDLARGAVTLAVVLGLLAACRTRPLPSYRPAALAAGALVAASLAASTSPAVAKEEFIAWQTWDLYDAPADPVGVTYVWEGQYDGVRFPKEKTVVLRIDAPRNARYWRATTLDAFDDHRWVERLEREYEADGRVTLFDPTYPPAARDADNWVRADVRVEALRDAHLVAGTMPVQFEADETGSVTYLTGNVAVSEELPERGDDYSTWTYAPQPTPKQLGRRRAGAVARPLLMRPYLEVAPGVAAPAFRARGREAQLRRLFYDSELAEYRRLYRAARRVAGATRNQYAAVVALEAWFRAEGGFVYDERPPLTVFTPPLVDFVTRTKRGYCQHFAGAMTLMLRYLGIPARVGAGFTTGTYDDDKGRWTVTDHDAHTWVEVWFPGFGWLPFDPTPSRGGLSGSYTTASRGFDPLGAAAVIGAGIFEGAGSDFPSSLAEKYAAEGTNFGARDRPGDLAALPSLPSRPDASLLRLLAVIAATLVVGMALLKFAVRRSRYLTRDPRRLAGACRRELVDFLADQGVAVPRSATTAEVGSLLGRQLAVDARDFVRAANTARFSPPDDAQGAAREARRELRRVLRHVRRRVGVLRRVRGTLSLRSLAA